MLNSGVSAWGILMKGCRCFSNGKRAKKETSAGRSCFGNKNDGGMADWNVFGNGKKWEVLNRGVSASGRKSPVFLSGVSDREKSLHSGVPQRCFGIVKNQQCCTAVFQHRESLFSLKNRSLLCFDPAKTDCRTIFLDRDY
jgi:hypothetical protein